jgi:alpha-tubulin suppressor-like RCC1 family protein
VGDKINRFIPVKLANIKAKSAVITFTSTFIIDLNDNLWVFGGNMNGQLGLGDKINRLIPTKLPNIKVRQIVCGEDIFDQTFIIDLNNELWVFGSNENGLGLGETIEKLYPTKIPNIRAVSVVFNSICTFVIDLYDNIWVN